MAFLSAGATREITITSKGNNIGGQPRIVKCYNINEKGICRECTQPERLRNAAWFKEKLMLAEAQEADQILDEEQLAFLADPKISKALDVQGMQYSKLTHTDDFQDNEIHSDSNIIPYS
uniref:Retrovirus-related Pol polyprotein from transposon TNT 1-94 n=1 Tax=Tanacetum cinerariifolium TaxID=118510 RepID=A0A699GQ53_TANCI|nr:hypothetical protein [Tanacetum cinerariifolium]